VAKLVDEVTLNWTDLTGKKTGATTLGSNKFYRAQLFDDCTVTFTWGRVGQAGQSKTITGDDMADAKKQMEKQLDSKTKKGYVKIDMRSDDEEADKAGAKPKKAAGPAKAKSGPANKGTYPKEVEELLDIIYGSTTKSITKGLSSTAGASEDRRSATSRTSSSTRAPTSSRRSRRCSRRSTRKTI